MPLRLHVDDPDLLREAMTFTARTTAFSARLVEKDYFCSVVLEFVAAVGAGLTFKGGTCLSKVHGDLYRLSEDLDFSVSTPIDAARADRSRSMLPIKDALAALPGELPGFRIVEPLRGANNSTQYNATVGYESLLDGHVEPVSMEIGVREPTMLDPHDGAARTALLNPVNGRPLVQPFPVVCLTYRETMAEKVRAALCRREVAIRDYFDVDHAVRTAGFDPLEPGFLDLVRRKLEIPRTGPVDVSDARVEQLRQQLDGQLLPVLREREFAQFDLQRAVEAVRGIARELVRA